MRMIDLIKRVFFNKILLYISSRYLIYALQFVLLIVVATKLGVADYGSWGFFLLLLGYCNIINWGIANSVVFYIVQNKNDEFLIRNYVNASYVLIIVIIVLLFLFSLVICCFASDLFVKYNILDKIGYLLVLASFQYINTLFSSIYRAKNKLFELALYQSSIPICMLIAVIFSPLNRLFDFLIYSYLIAHSISLLIFVVNGQLPRFSLVSIVYMKQLFSKGFFLFVYNSCFYLIHPVTSLVISVFYSVEEYGLYSFSYSLGHSILLLLEAFAFVVFPKLVDKFYLAKKEDFSFLISIVRNNYIKLSHFLMYLALLFFPLITFFFSQYSGSLQTMYITSLSILVSTNAFGYNTLLLAKNKERSISKVSVFSLLLNIIVVYIIAGILKLSFTYAVMSMMIVYYVFSLGCIILTNRKFDLRFSIYYILNESFEWKLLIPFLLALVLSLMRFYSLMFLPILCFISLNFASIKEIVVSVKRIVVKPNVVDVN